MSLEEYFSKACRKNTGVTHNSYLAGLAGSVKDVSDAMMKDSDDSILKQYNKELMIIIKKPHFESDGSLTNEFAQKLGEVHFYLMCKNKAVYLDRVPEGKHKTPDFKLESNDMYFEVKTLSVVSGDFGINTSLQDGMKASIDMEKQVLKGKKWHLLPM